jgi:hypothetical protein
MNRHAPPALLLALLPAMALADPPRAPPPAAASLCRPAIAAAERAHGIPPHLLAAIARVESGRRDEASGTVSPWPWTINKDGAGSFYEGKAQAVAAAEAMRPKVARSIDVGCMQISLTMHPKAFAGMEQAFDPAANADYGARFLAELYGKTGSWPKAVGMYHSGTPELAADYQAKVYAALPGEQRVAVAAAPVAAAGAAGIGASPFGAGRHPFPVAAAVPPRTIPLASGPSGVTGRTLESYRTAPVRMAYSAVRP